MRTTTSLLLACLLLHAAASPAATYRWVDASGVVHYSDTPQPGAQQIDLPSAQTYSNPSASAKLPARGGVPPQPGARTASTSSSDKSTVGYQSCAIASPGSDEVLFEQSSLSVTITTDPPKRPGDYVELTLDGATVPLTSPGSTDFQISPIDRGTHTLSAVVRGSGDATLCTAQPVTFHVRQPSVLAPNSPRKK